MLLARGPQPGAGQSSRSLLGPHGAARESWGLKANVRHSPETSVPQHDSSGGQAVLGKPKNLPGRGLCETTLNL